MSEDLDQSTIRLDFSVVDPTILTSLYISCVVLLAFMMTGLLLHRKAKDQRLHLFSSSKLFAVHLVGCMFVGLCGLISVYGQHPLFHAFNAFCVFVVVIFFNHLGCSKYRYYRTVSVCCHKPESNLLFRLIFVTENKYNLALSGSLVFVNIIWWLYYSITIEDLAGSDRLMDANNKWSQEYVFFLIIMYAIVVLHTGIAALYSKISLAVFCVLMPLFILCLGSAMHFNSPEERASDLTYEYLLIYWFVFLFAITSSISFFACSKDLKLQLISIGLIGGFLSIFDLLTDLVLIITWFREGAYFWVTVQVIFILSGTIYSSVFITRFYFEKDRRDQYIGQALTLLGLGRLWHGILAWDMDNHSYVMLLGNKMIKIWEMFLESYPSIFLQLWIVLSEFHLRSESTNPVIWSLAVSLSSITFTVFRILYFDHRARHKNSGIFQDAVEQIDDEIIKEQIARVEALHPGPQQHTILEPEEELQEIIELEVAAEGGHNKASPQSVFNMELISSQSISSEPFTPMGTTMNDDKQIDSKKQIAFKKQIEQEQYIRNQIEAQEERVRDALSRRRQERELSLADASVTITFLSKPLGCTLYRGEEEKNAWIADVKPGNQYIEHGLRIGLYVHTINYEIVDNDSYYGILTRVRDLPAPVVIGFNPYPPLNPDDECILNLQKMDFTFIDISCAWQYINRENETITSAHREFESKMLQVLTQFNQIDESVMISQYQEDLRHFASFDRVMMTNEENDDDDDSSSNSSDLYAGNDLLPGYYYTQRELESDDDNKSEYKYDEYTQYHLKQAQQQVEDINRNGRNSYELFLADDNGDNIGPRRLISESRHENENENLNNSAAFARFESEEKQDIIKNKVVRFESEEKHDMLKEKEKAFVRFDSTESSKQKDFARFESETEQKASNLNVHVTGGGGYQPFELSKKNAGGRTRGGSQAEEEQGAANLAELIGAVEKVQPEELITITFKRKPLGFDREAGRFGINCRVLSIHIQKLKDRNLCEGFYLRQINSRYVERLKFHAIESLLRNAACPMTLIFRMTEPPLPDTMLRKLELREYKKQQRKLRRKLKREEIEDDIKEEEEEEHILIEEEEEGDHMEDDMREEEEVTIRYASGEMLSFEIAAGVGDVNAKIVSIADVKLYQKGVRLGMFIHRIDACDVNYKAFGSIRAELDVLVQDQKRFSITFSIYKPIDFGHKTVRALYENMNFSKSEVLSAWTILNRQKIDKINDIEFDDIDFEPEMLKILISEREIEDKFYEKINKNRHFGLDFDPGKPITIFFEKRPLGFEIESGDELSDGKNAKISLITNDHYHSIGLKIGMLIHKINAQFMDNSAFANITQILRTHKLPMTITFTKSIALSNLKYVTKCTFGQRPFGFEIIPSNAETGQCPAIVDQVSNKKLKIQKIKAGMFVHNVNGIDVMNNMKLQDLESMLDRLQLPIVVGFIDMDRVHVNPIKVIEIKKDNKNENNVMVHRQDGAVAHPNALELEIIKQSEMVRRHRESIGGNRKQKFDCCTRACLADIFNTKSLHYLSFYIFTITELYCRIYPMLVVAAYTKKRADDNNESDSQSIYVYLVALGELLLILTFETIAYKQILLEEYASWKTVFKQLYFATFTISFFLLSTMGLAYLERNVDFQKLMKVEFTGRQLIGFLLVGFVTLHQAITLNFNEWVFGPTIYLYYIMLFVCVAAHFYLKAIYHQL